MILSIFSHKVWIYIQFGSNLTKAWQISKKLKGDKTLNRSFVTIWFRWASKLELQPNRTLIFHFSFTERVLVNIYKTFFFQALMTTHKLYIYIYIYLYAALNTHKIHQEWVAILTGYRGCDCTSRNPRNQWENQVFSLYIAVYILLYIYMSICCLYSSSFL